MKVWIRKSAITDLIEKKLGKTLRVDYEIGPNLEKIELKEIDVQDAIKLLIKLLHEFEQLKEKLASAGIKL